MDQAPTIACRFEGCPKRIKLSWIGHHEAFHCDHAIITCRYRDFGCSWIGKCRDVPLHKQQDSSSSSSCCCSCSKLSGCIHQARHLLVEIPRTIHQFQHQTTLPQLQILQNQRIQRSSSHSRTDVVSWMFYGFEMTCSSVCFVTKKDSWSSYWKTVESRAAVLNGFLWVPTMVICITTTWSAYCHLLHHLQKKFRWEEWEEEIINRFGIGYLGMLVTMANLVGGKSNLRWSRYPIPWFKHVSYNMGDLVAIFALTIYTTTFQFLQLAQRHKGASYFCYSKFLVVWLCLVFSTTVFPGVISAIAENVAG